MLSFTFFGQENQPWRSFFSYNDIVDVTQSNGKVFGAASSAMFQKNLGNNELKTITSVDGLKVETITAVHHSTAFNRTLVGNSNGLLIVIKRDNTIVNKIGIIQETTVPGEKKKINNIYEYNGKAYISCDFGIAVFNLETLEFGDTYYLGPNGAEIPISQCTVFNGVIYAASPTHGMMVGQYNNPNLNDYSQWTPMLGGQWTSVITFEDHVFASDTTGSIFKIETANSVPFFVMNSIVTDLREANGYMVITAANQVVVFNNQYGLMSQINVIPLPEAEGAVFSCATVVAGTVFVGTTAKGMFSAPFNSFSFENITPNGPERSNIFSLKKAPSALWAVYGDYSYSYNPHPLEYFGVSKFTDIGWTTIPNKKLFDAASISDIIVNPSNENQVYAASFHSGLIKIENDLPTAIYSYQPVIQNGPESLVDPTTPAYKSTRINSLAFDKTGNLWMTNARVEKAIKVLKKEGTWSSYVVKGIKSFVGTDYGKMAIDKNGTKWIPSAQNGLIAFNEKLDKYIIINNDQTGNLPSFNAKCVAIDNNNRLWIGTDKGLRVIPGVDRFTTEETLTANAIIIMEDGLAQELMYEQGIVDIVVDGANNKWIGTGGAGAFLVSPDGQQTLFHFTKENSPLPSNAINDIEIDHATGEVFFATDKGMVSYRGTSTEAADDLSKVYVFPNPVRPGFEGDVNISALVDDANVKITDIEGNLVFETTSEGGTVLWDTRAFGKYKVASGVYMIFISSEDGTKTKVKKVMIIR
ncbi:Two component regulator propeller [compost metagenome]